jgi:hypothetical protein
MAVSASIPFGETTARRFVVRRRRCLGLRKDVGEVEFVVLGDNHAPKAIFYVKFGKNNGSVIVGRGRQGVNDSRKYSA